VLAATHGNDAMSDLAPTGEVAVIGAAADAGSGGRVESSEDSAAAEFDVLMAALQRHEDTAIVEVHARWADAAEALARTLVPGREGACHDIVQAAFIRLIQSPPKQLPDEAALERWLRRAVVSAAIDWMRREATQRRRVVEAAGHTGVTGTEHGAASVPRGDALAELELRLSTLDAADRELVIMHHAKGMTLAAVAEAVGITLGSAYGRIRRAMVRLRGMNPTDARGDEQ
jgi:RNA polymerase sigma factor (sigma-70 family)